MIIISNVNGSAKQKDDFELVFKFWRVRQSVYFSNRLIQRQLAAKKTQLISQKNQLKKNQLFKIHLKAFFRRFFLRSSSIKKINSFLREITEKLIKTGRLKKFLHAQNRKNIGHFDLFKIGRKNIIFNFFYSIKNQ